MNTSNSPDPIEALLRDETRYLEDDGFTAQVLAALPHPRRRPWLRPGLLLGSLLAAAWLAWAWMPWSLMGAPTIPALFTAGVLLISIFAAFTWGVIATVLGD